MEKQLAMDYAVIKQSELLDKIALAEYQKQDTETLYKELLELVKQTTTLKVDEMVQELKDLTDEQKEYYKEYADSLKEVGDTDTINGYLPPAAHLYFQMLGCKTYVIDNSMTIYLIRRVNEKEKSK